MTPADDPVPTALDETTVRVLLGRHWALDPARVAPLGGGMNSETWEVATPEGRWVVKAVVPRDTRGFEAGLHAASALEAAGVPAGAPRPTTDGALAVRLPAATVALLRWVDGRELDGSGDDPTAIGTTLAKAHRVLAATHVPDAPPFDWIDLRAGHLDAEPWVRPAVSAVLDEWAGARHRVTTWGFLHGDPAPEAFRQDTTGTCGLIDWAGGVHGPCLYDVASAAMYLGPDDSPAMVDAYRRHGVVGDRELDELPTLLRLRFAVQADYFARRVHESDLTGIAGDEGNRKGLADARRLLGA